jgi:hypothetical protein
MGIFRRLYQDARRRQREEDERNERKQELIGACYALIEQNKTQLETNPWIDITSGYPTLSDLAGSVYRYLYNHVGGFNCAVARLIRRDCPEISVHYDANTNRVFISPYHMTREEHTVTRPVEFDGKHLRVGYQRAGLDGTYNIAIDLRNGITLRALRRLQKNDDTVALYITDDNDETKVIRMSDLRVDWDIPNTTEIEKYIDNVHFTIQSIDITTVEWIVGDGIVDRMRQECFSNITPPDRVDDYMSDAHVVIRLAVDEKQQEEVNAKKTVIADFLKQED